VGGRYCLSVQVGAVVQQHLGHLGVSDFASIVQRGLPKWFSQE